MVSLKSFLVLIFAATAIANQCSKSMYEKLGCFKRQQKLLPALIVNDRDPTHANFSNKKIDWANYSAYLDEFTCRCSDKAKALGYKYFGLGFYGECFAGKDVGLFNQVMQDFEQGSMGCINGNYWACESSSVKPCIGGSDTEYIYMVVSDDEEEGEE